MKKELRKSDILRLYFRAHHISDDQIDAMIGLQFGKGGFMEDMSDANEETMQKMADAFQISDDLLIDGSAENMEKHGLLRLGKDRFYYAMLLSGMTPMEVGRKSGCGVRNVNSLLDGKDRPTEQQLEQLSKTLDVSIDFLMLGIIGKDMEEENEAEK